MGININISYAGWDSGYDTCKLITNMMQNNNQSPLVFPSLAKERSKGLISEKELGIGREFSKERMLLEVKDKDDNYYDFMVGDYVVTQLETGGANYEVDKYNAPEELAKLLAGLTTLHPNATSITVDTLVTGLPIQHHRNHKEDMRKRFEGKFEARLNNHKGEKVTVTYEFKNVVVIPQAAGALLYYLNIAGSENVMNNKVAILDIGGRTTDGLAYNQGEIIKESPFSANVGMSNVFRTVSNQLNIDENKIREAVINGEDTIRYNQEEKVIKEIVNSACHDVSREIVNETRSEWRDFISVIDKILVVGGSGKILEPYLKEDFGKIEVELVDNPQEANVLGYVLRGQALKSKEEA